MPQVFTFKSPKLPLAAWLFVAASVLTVAAVGAVVAWIDHLCHVQARAEAIHLLQTNAQLLRDGFAQDAPSPQAVLEIPALLQQVARAAGAEILILDASGVVLLGPSEWEGRRFERSVAERAGDLVAESSSPGTGHAGWTVVLRQTERLAMATNQHLRTSMLEAALLVCVTTALLLGLIAKRFSALLIRAAALGDANTKLSASLGELARREERVAAILENAPDAFIAIDGNGRVTDWNRAAETMLGWTSEEATGQVLSSLIVPHHPRRTEDLGRATFDHLGTRPALGQQAKLDLHHRDGRHVQAELSVGQLRGDRGFAFAFLRDIGEREEAQQRIAQSERRLAEVLSNIPAMVGHFDHEERCLFVNDRALEVHGLTAEQALGKFMRESISKKVYELHEPHIRQVLSGKHVMFDAVDIRDARVSHYQVNLVPETDTAGEVRGFYLMTFDVTAMKSAKAELECSEARLRAITDNLPVMISYIDRDSHLQFVNRTFEQWTGIPVANATGKPLRDVIGDELFQQREEPLRRALGGQRVEFEIESEALDVRKNLHTVYVPDIEPNGRIKGVYALTNDVTVQRDAERRMAELALNDPLTGLPNRRRLNDRLPDALTRARRMTTGVAVLFLDVDRFKSINDTHGHAAGDDVLIEFSRRLTRSVRNTDFVARLAGDEFVVILEGLHSMTECDIVADKVVKEARRPLHIGSTVLCMSTSIGVAYLPSTIKATPAVLLKVADEALYRTKERGRDGYTCVQVETDLALA